MSKTLKKILAASSALLMLTGAGASFNSPNVNAKHHYRSHRVYHHRRARHHHVQRETRGAGWYYHNASHLKRRYLHKNHNFDQGWVDADSVNSRNMQYGGMTEKSSNCFPQMTSNRAGRGRYGEGWVTGAYYQWNDTHGHMLNSHRSNRKRNLRNIIRNYNNGIHYLRSGLSRNSQTGNIYMSKHGHWFTDNHDNY